MIFTNKASCATNDSLERLIFYSEGANLARQSTELSCILIDLPLCPIAKNTSLTNHRHSIQLHVTNFSDFPGLYLLSYLKSNLVVFCHHSWQSIFFVYKKRKIFFIHWSIAFFQMSPSTGLLVDTPSLI